MYAVPRGRSARVRGLDVRVRADDRRHTTVEPARERHLLAGRLGMHVDENHRRLRPRLLDEVVDDLEHRGRGMEEQRAEDVDHRQPPAVGRRHGGKTSSRRAARHVGGADDSIRSVEVRPDLGAPEGMVAERDRICARRQQLFGQTRRDPDSVRGVLAVHDARVDLELRAERLQALRQSSPPGSPHDVGDEENAQGAGDFATGRRASPTGTPGSRRCCRGPARSARAPGARSG